MKTFDYKTAWEQVARPGFEALPRNIRELYDRVCRECEGLNQERETLDMPWPEQRFDASPGETSLYHSFDQLPTEWLAQAAHLVYFYGHWSPKGHSYAGSGGTWKFANYADQILRKKLDLPKGEYGKPGYGFHVVEGFLRFHYSDKDTWTWREVGLATAETLARARRFFEDHLSEPLRDIAELRRPQNSAKHELFEKWAGLMADELWPVSPFLALLKDKERYMVEESR